MPWSKKIHSLRTQLALAKSSIVAIIALLMQKHS